MRFVTRTLMFVIVILVTFWFTAENAREIVNIDLSFLRIRTSLPVVVFSSILAGMAASTVIGWWAERRRRRRVEAADRDLLSSAEPTYDFMEDVGSRESDPLERIPYN